MLGGPLRPGEHPPCRRGFHRDLARPSFAVPHASPTARSAIVMEVERQLGFKPIDRQADRLRSDIESGDPRTGRPRFIGVDRMLTSLNKSGRYILAIVA
jgi:hypothetical protein